MKIKIVFSMIVISLLLITGCVQKTQYDFPINNEEPRAGFGDLVYSVCEDELTKDRTYKISSCGIDSCDFEFYNTTGTLIEKGSTGMVANPHEFKTKVSNCKRTTEEYFKSKIKI